MPAVDLDSMPCGKKKFIINKPGRELLSTKPKLLSSVKMS